MAENFNHPPVFREHENQSTIEDDFVCQAFSILHGNHVYCSEFSGDYSVEYPITDRADIGYSAEGQALAVRLRRRPTFSMVSSETNTIAVGQLVETEPAEQYLVMELQYGSLNLHEAEDINLAVDEDYEWQPYVLMVVDMESKEVDVLDPQTGNTMSVVNIMQVSYFMGQLDRELSVGKLESELEVGAILPVRYAPAVPDYEELPSSEEFDLNYNCPHCGSRSIFCCDTSPKLN